MTNPEWVKKLDVIAESWLEGKEPIENHRSNMKEWLEYRSCGTAN